MTERIRVLFVDDEPHVLNGMRRTMIDMDQAWDMAFCTNGAEALALVHERAFDVIVSDMRMPQMNGAQLLEAIRSIHPGTIRIILSGYADAETVLRTVGPAHMYMAKPCDRTILRTAIDRAISLRRLLNSDNLREALTGLVNLPSVPDLFLKIAAELQSPNASAKAVADIIGRDPAMMAELLKLTNTAYFAVAAQVTTPLQAVRTLGLETVQALVLRSGIFRQFNGSTAARPLIEGLADYSLVVAKLAEDIALAEGASNSIAKGAYCAGMLSSVGSLILLDAGESAYRDTLARVREDMPLHVAEEQAFGSCHAVIGAYLLGLWGFPDMIVEAVAYCCTPQYCPGRDNLVLTAVHAARALGPPMPLLPPEAEETHGLAADYVRDIGKYGALGRWQELASRYVTRDHG